MHTQKPPFDISEILEKIEAKKLEVAKAYEEKSHNFENSHPAVVKEEFKILRQGHIKKKNNWYVKQSRMFILTNEPRLIYKKGD